MSTVCFKAAVTGLEEALGEKAAAISLIAAGRQRGKQLAEELGLSGKGSEVPLDVVVEKARYSRRPLTDLPEAELLPLAELSEREALELLERYGGGIAEPERSKSLVQCDRLPLAVTLISKTLKQQPPQDLVEKVEWLFREQQRFAQRNLSHSMIRACFSLSYQTLDSTAAHLLCLLGLFAETTFTATLAATLLDAELETPKQPCSS